MKMDAPLKIMFTAIMSLCTSLILVAGYYVWPWEPIVIYSIKITTPVVCTGGLLVYEAKIDKREDVACVVKRNLANSYLITYDPTEPPRKELGPQIVTARLHVPLKTDPGNNWEMNWTVECEKPFKKPFVWSLKDKEKFTVVDCDPPTKGQKGDPGKPGKDGKGFWGK
jgi:hypothetical protein